MMKRFTVGTATLVIAFMMICCTVQASELAKEGTGEYRSGRSAKVDVMKMGKDRAQINYDETGVVVDAPTDSPFHNASFHTMGTIHAVNGVFTYSGAAVWTRPNGDEIYGIFKGDGRLGATTNTSLEIVGGQGECEGITGGMELQSGPHRKSPKKGWSVGTTVGTVHWKIP